MNVSPLPLIDNCLFIDNSSWIEGMMSCYRYLQYKSLNLRIPTAEKPSLNFGSAIHLGLEYRYKTYKNSAVDDKYYNDMVEILTPHFAAHPPPLDDWRTLNWAMDILRKYNDRYSIEDFSLIADKNGSPMVELSFAIPICFANITTGEIAPYAEQKPPGEIWITVVYSGKIDLPVAIEKQPWICDHKTTSMLGNQFWDDKRMSAQQKGYVWAFQRITGITVQGFIVNAIRTKAPPQYLSDPKGKGKLTPAQWWNDSFARERFYVDQANIKEWEFNTLDLIAEFFFHYLRGYFPMKTIWCSSYGRCPYYEICRMVPSDRDAMLYSGQFADNTWTPLKQPTQAKQ